MSIEQMRQFVEAQYPSDSWKYKVKKMSDAQIVAIYNRFKRSALCISMAITSARARRSPCS
jgi:hypothetical protein